MTDAYTTEALARADRMIIKLQGEIELLKQGSCRHNCMTPKENFQAGFDIGYTANTDDCRDEAWLAHKAKDK